MTISTVAVTADNGKIGSAILKRLVSHGNETTNISRGKCREEISVTYITSDLLNAGEPYSALASTEADAAIHMGTILGPYNYPNY